jgi:hypothetical protein
VYRLGDKVEIQVVRVDLERRQVDFALMDVLARAAAGSRKGRPPSRVPRAAAIGTGRRKRSSPARPARWLSPGPARAT